MTEFMFTLTIITLVLAVYYLIYHLGTVWIVMIAAVQIARETRWPHKFEEIETFSNPLAPLVSVIVPAHNEEAGSLLRSTRCGTCATQRSRFSS